MLTELFFLLNKRTFNAELVKSSIIKFFRFLEEIFLFSLLLLSDLEELRKTESHKKKYLCFRFDLRYCGIANICILK